VLNHYTQDIKHKEDELAIQYLPAVKAMSFRLKERLPSSIDYMDLSAIGTEELIKLARRYDEKLNRSLDVLSRASRKLVKAIDYAVEEYRVTHDDEPTDKELSIILDEDIDKVHDARIASSIYTVMPLHDQLHVGDEGAALARVEKEELVDVIKKVLDSYTQREQMIIQLYYFEELTLKEISDILSITESRISQIHKSVLQKIKQSVGVSNG